MVQVGQEGKKGLIGGGREVERCVCDGVCVSVSPWWGVAGRRRR